MQINIRTSEKNQKVVTRLTLKLPKGTKENVIARIALAYSLQLNKKFSSEELNQGDSKGKEYKDSVLFDAEYRDFYIAMISQHYGIYKSDENISKYIKKHIDHGLEAIDNFFQNSNCNFTEFLMERIEKGLNYLNDLNSPFNHVKNPYQDIGKSYFSDLIKINVGSELENNKTIELQLNNTESYNNCHIAVAGNSGTGKTQFALEIISQIAKISKGRINYIYLDFKGLKQDDKRGMKDFFTTTQTDFIDIPQDSFPVNPLTFIDNINEKNRNMGIDKFVDIICKYSNLGVKQKGKLREATKEAFLSQKGGNYPTVSQVNKILREKVDKEDSLTEIMNDLSRYEIFNDSKKQKNFLNKNLYLSLSGDLPNSVRFTSLFLVLNYIYNTFMNMDNTPVEKSIKTLRYMIVIDEAHVLFKEKKYQEILEKILREIRSKGVSVILLSQGIEEYHQPDFDFSTMCEIAFLLNIKNRKVKIMEKFLGVSGNDGTKIARSMENISKGQAISNIKEFDTAKLFQIKQYFQKK